MKVYLNDLYLAKGHVIRNRIKKGDCVVISFDNIKALGESTINDLQEFVGLPNVEVIGTTRYIDNQLGIEVERSVSQLELF